MGTPIEPRGAPVTGHTRWNMAVGQSTFRNCLMFFTSPSESSGNGCPSFSQSTPPIVPPEDCAAVACPPLAPK